MLNRACHAQGLDPAGPQVLALVKSAGSTLDLSPSPAAFAERLRTTLSDETRVVRQLQLKP